MVEKWALSAGVTSVAEKRTAQPEASWILRLAWLPIPLFFLAIGLLAIFRVEAVWNPTYLIPSLNVFFGVVTFFVPIVAARSYLQGRSMLVLLMGCGTLALGLGGLGGQVFILDQSMNSNIAIISMMGCLSGFCHLSIAAGSLLAGPRRMRSGLPLLLASYLVILIVFSVLFLLIQYQVWPAHYVEGSGTTALGKAALWTASGFFMISACLLMVNRVPAESGFRLWYGLGIGLLAVDYFGVSLQAVTGDPLNWVSRSAAYLGAIYALIAVVSSVTRSGEWALPIDRSLRETEALYKSLVEMSPDAILVYADDKCAFVNPAAVRLFGAGFDGDLLGRDASEMVPADFYPYIRQQIDQTQGGVPMPLVESRFVRLDGQQIYVEVTGAKVEFGGRPAIQYFARDITGRKQLEKALQDREDHLKLRLNALLSPEGDLGERAIEEILDLPALQKIMDSFYDIIGIGITIEGLSGNILITAGWQDLCTNFHRCHPVTLQNCLESDLHLSGSVAEGEYVLYQCKNGLWDVVTPIVVGGKHVADLFSGQFVFEDEAIDYARFERQAEKYGFDKGEYLAALDRVPRVSREKVRAAMELYTQFAGMISQISYNNARLAKALIEQKQAENELLEAKAQAELYLDLMGHDISNMHQIILGQLELVQGSLDASGKQEADYRDLIDNSIGTLQRSARLIENVRNMQMMKAGSYPLQRIDLGEVLDDAVRVYSGLTGRDITIRYTPVGTCHVLANLLLKDIFSNLLDNAAKHCEDPVVIGIVISLRKNGGQSVYEVTLEDNGRGISDERKGEIFLRLKRGETKARGTGLGLYIVKTLVESFGGSVKVEDRVSGDHQKGAKFIVSLPVYDRL